MAIPPYAVLIYGILVILGGLIGYIQAKSRASLIAGGISGAVLIISGVMMIQGIFAGTYLALAVTLVLTVTFSRRFSAKRKFMPSGLMLLLSILMSVVLIVSSVMHFLFGPRG